MIHFHIFRGLLVLIALSNLCWSKFLNYIVFKVYIIYSSKIVTLLHS